MSKEYIEDCDGNFYVAGTRISLDSIIHAFRRGESPETICQNFELLDLEQVYGAIAHYLAHTRTARGFDVCIVDHPVFDELRTINATSGMPTVIASQNIESLDVGRLRLDSTLLAHTATIDLANELRSLARYSERFAIS